MIFLIYHRAAAHTDFSFTLSVLARPANACKAYHDGALTLVYTLEGLGALRCIPKPHKDACDVAQLRPLMLLETLLKIVLKIIDVRLQDLIGVRGLEAQTGFTRGKGRRDAIFAVRTYLQRRRECGL